MKRAMTGLMALLWMVGGLAAHAESFHSTSAAVTYKCLFNHELLIVCEKNMSAESIGAFIDKLEPTDVDAVMCCPTMWRANVFPSKIDTAWADYDPASPLSAFPRFDCAMKYIHGGGDPVKETLAACRRAGKDFFISYRMNDHHYVTDVTWPTHNFIWRDHPEYWLGDSDTSPYERSKDNVRLLNYMLPEVRDYYFSIIEELCTNYDVDGVEFDFQRFPRFFRNDEIEAGKEVMTGFVKRVRALLDRLGKERGKSLKICIRIPETLAKCEKAGLDVLGWDAQGLVDMVNVSTFFFHSMEADIEGFKRGLKHAKLYGEMNYATYQTPEKKRRYTTFEIYRASALNLFYRGVDGLSLFNYDYIPPKLREPMAEGLKGITDIAFLESMPKNYAIYPGFGTFPVRDEQAAELIVADDPANFERALLRIETKKPCPGLEIAVWLNGKLLEPCEHEDTELFPPLERNEAYAVPEAVRFYKAPLDGIVRGLNRIEIKNLDKEKTSRWLFSLELALYR